MIEGGERAAYEESGKGATIKSAQFYTSSKPYLITIGVLYCIGEQLRPMVGGGGSSPHA